jgi:predicted outer membrane lipoprotein
MPGYIAMKKLAVTAFMLGILTAPAFAQSKDMEPLELMDRDKKQQAEALDKQYKKMMDRNRKESDAQQRSDPWSNMRAPNEGKGK